MKLQCSTEEREKTVGLSPARFDKNWDSPLFIREHIEVNIRYVESNNEQYDFNRPFL